MHTCSINVTDDRKYWLLYCTGCYSEWYKKDQVQVGYVVDMGWNPVRVKVFLGGPELTNLQLGKQWLMDS